jgi:hypothetical protein
VTNTPEGLPQHLAGWQDILRRNYGLETQFAMAVEQSGTGEPVVRGVLPLFHVSTPLLGTTVTTTPGGLCAQDEQAAAVLLTHARQCAAVAGARRLVIHDSRRAWDGLAARAIHETRILDLSPGHDAVWQGLDRNVRRQVRMAERNGVTVEIDRTGARVGDFYHVISRFMQGTGTPVYSLRFLEDVICTFPNGVHLAVAYYDGKPVGAYFQLSLGKTLYGLWGATLPAALSLRTVYAVYWAILADAMKAGLHALDMGRSPAGSNAARYKAQWGGCSHPVYQQSWRPNGFVAVAQSEATQAGTQANHVANGTGHGEAMDEPLSARAEADVRLRFVRRVWSMLPLGVTQTLGPVVRRHVPFG